jgi:hypothetical protein
MPGLRGCKFELSADSGRIVQFYDAALVSNSHVDERVEKKTCSVYATHKTIDAGKMTLCSGAVGSEDRQPCGGWLFSGILSQGYRSKYRA